MATPEELKRAFTYHPPSDVKMAGLTQAKRYEHLRACAFAFAQAIQEFTPQSREQSLAMTNLEQSVMWANAAIARNEV